MKVLVTTRFNKEALDISLGMLTSLCNIKDQDLIVAGLNVKSDIQQYLASQSRFKYMLADENDLYGEVLNTVVREFLDEGENLVIIDEGSACFPDIFTIAEQYLSSKNVGAIIFEQCTSDEGEFEDLYRKHVKNDHLLSLVGWGDEGLMISGEMINAIGLFDETYINPKNVLVDYLFLGGQKGFKIYKASDCVKYIFPKMPVNESNFLKEQTIRDKWGMNYFTYTPNEFLVGAIPKDFKGEVNVLEIGCDCGGNGAGVREIYPDCHLYGLELNPNSAKIAATIYDEVIVGNVEEMDLPFGDVLFDIVVFGDVLEHLRDP